MKKGRQMRRLCRGDKTLRNRASRAFIDVMHKTRLFPAPSETGTTIPVPRSKYEANGYKPDFDKLPSEAEYWAAEKKKEDDAKGA